MKPCNHKRKERDILPQVHPCRSECRKRRFLRWMNGAGGNDTKNAVLKKPDGKDIKMSEVKEAAEKRPVWLFITGTKGSDAG